MRPVSSALRAADRDSYGAHVAEFGITARARIAGCVKDDGFARQRPVGAIGVPGFGIVDNAYSTEIRTDFIGHDQHVRIVWAEIKPQIGGLGPIDLGQSREFRFGVRFVPRGGRRVDVPFELTEQPSESCDVNGGEYLVSNDQHRVI